MCGWHCLRHSPCLNGLPWIMSPGDPWHYGYRGWRRTTGHYGGCPSLVLTFHLRSQGHLKFIWCFSFPTSFTSTRTRFSPRGWIRNKDCFDEYNRTIHTVCCFGVRKSQNILFPFFIVLLFMWCLKIIFLRGSEHPRCSLHVMKEQTNDRHSMWHKAEPETGFPWPVTHASRINTVSFAKASSFYLRWNSARIAAKSINHPHLIMERSLSKFSWKSQLRWMKGMGFFER